MKPSIPYPYRPLKTAQWGVFILICLALSRIASLAATVTWSGSGGDDLWNNPANWTGGVLPTGGDDVVIDVPGDITVRMNAPGTTVRSLQCEEGFYLENGPFTVTNGASVINGAFSMKPNYRLTAAGPSTVFTFNGTVTNLWTLHADNGAVLSLPTVGELTFGRGTVYPDWSASGPGSAIQMTNLTRVALQSGFKLDMNANGGGRIDVPRLEVPYGSLRVDAQGSNSLIDLSGFSGLWTQGFNGGFGSGLSAGQGGTVLIPNVTAMDQVALALNEGANVTLDQLRSFTGSSLSLTSRTNGINGLTNFSGSLSVHDSRLDWTNITELRATGGDLRVVANNNSVIDLSGLTNVAITANHRLYLTAQSGSQLDLHRLAQPGGTVIVESRLGSGLVDLSGFVGLWEGKGSSVSADNGCSVLIPNVTAMRDVSLDIGSESIVPTAQIQSIIGGSIGLRDRTNGFEGLTHFSANLTAHNTRLDLTNFTVIYATNGYVDFGAYQGSFIDLSRVTNVVTTAGYRLYASAYGGRIDLSGLTSADAGVSAVASGAGSHVNLSGLRGTWEPGDYAGNLTIIDGGTLLIPNITATKGVSLSVSGNADLDLSRIESMLDASLSFTSYTNSLDALTNFSGSLTANNAQLNLTNLTVLLLTNRNNYFFTAERGGVLNLSNVVRFITAPNSGSVIFDASRGVGGRIDLSSLQDHGGRLSVIVAGPKGVVDLSGLNGLLHDGVGLSVGSEGTLLIPNVTAMDGVSMNVTGGHVALSQLQSYVNGTLNLGQRTNVFTSLTNFQGSMNCHYLGRGAFPALTQLDTTNGFVQFSASGGYIDLSHVTNALVKTQGLNVSASSGGYVDLSNLETISAGNVQVTASGADAAVDLSGLTGFFSDSNEGRFSTSSGGVILLNSDAMLIAGVAFDFQSNPGGPLPPFLAAARELVLYGKPWRSYRIEARNPAEAGSPWRSYLPRVALTDSLLSLGARPPRDLILRVYSFIADPPEVDLRRGASGTLETILFGKPESHYRLESTVNPGSGGWQEVLTTTLTNSFHILPAVRATNTARFYRGLEL